jgi:3-methylcrotonyl-CoA carboxylase alpha subunit
MLKSLLIANRGEIACRIIRTTRKLGVQTVAVYSDADAKALHVRMADEAVHIGPSPARESYLAGERIIAAAKETGAEAIHPGYGFLSENADFAQAVIDAGLVWVGPKPDSIRAMGLKDAAKTLMADAGVPVTPGYLGEDQSPERLKAEADAIGYPVLIKAVAGGGGKGMRRVDEAAAFLDALDSCKREASSSFGNDIVLLEKYILSPRHIEVQVFGDSHGNVVHLFERDCSLQRRHQKVIEEAPAPGMDEATRAAVCGAAVRAAEAVNYEGAGTIEFIADASQGLRADRIWFMEMNTRLQVEHPVTEEVTGQDLVEWQLRVASGEPLPKRQDELSITGHAIEARLYAEDPAKGFLPSVGRLERLNLGMESGWTIPAPHAPVPKHRIETAVEQEDSISEYYDPMIAKLVVSASDRPAAIGALARSCDQVLTWPVRNNAGFLAGLLRHPIFVAGTMTTGFVESGGQSLAEPPSVDTHVMETAASLIFQEEGGSLAAVDPEDYPHRYGGPWRDQIGFRLNQEPRKEAWLKVNGQPLQVPIGVGKLLARSSHMTRLDHEIIIVDRGWPHVVTADRWSGTTVGIGVGNGTLIAPMPGKVTSVDVSAGEQVTKGQRLLTLEAMKMEHAMVAPFDGVVAELNVAAGAQVQVEAVLARVKAAEI